MSLYTVVPLFVLVSLIQSTVTSSVHILGASPDLVLMMAVACVLQWGVRESLIAVLVGGLTIDALSGAPFGCATLSIAIVSVLAGIAESNVPRSVKTLPYAAVAVATIVYQLIWMLLLQIWGRTVLWVPMFVRGTLPSVFVNTLAMPLMCLFVRALDRRVPDEPTV